MFTIGIDLSELLTIKDEIKGGNVNKKLEEAAHDVTLQIHAHIVEQAQSKLHSSRQTYLDALHMTQVNGDTWLITLDKKAMWIEDGTEKHSMVMDLLSSPKARTTASGKKILSVPFEHKKGGTQQTPDQKQLTDAVKGQLKSRGIPYGKLEMDQKGNPKLGLLHSLDLKTPLKTHEGKGQGQGPIGDQKQGHTGIPYLQGLKIYQKEFQTPQGPKVKKSIVTFRTVSSNDIGSDKWVHPGVEAKHFFEEALTWVMKEIDDKISGTLLNKLF